MKALRRASGFRHRSLQGYTLIEVMVAGTVAVMILAGAMSFINFTSVTMSGITAQSTLNDQAADAVQLLQSRARVATSVSNNPAGDTVYLGFDDNYDVDSNGDKLPYNDADHIEQFQFLGTSTSIQSSTNILVYTSTNGAMRVLIPTGVCKLPGRNIFTVTNKATLLIRFAVVDTYARDRFQSIDIQSACVLMNRRTSTNIISILP